MTMQHVISETMFLLLSLCDVKGEAEKFGGWIVLLLEELGVEDARCLSAGGSEFFSAFLPTGCRRSRTGLLCK